jgi:VIT1/CCC1 family predicted Fe2+/Mn2+ transporter
MATNADEGKLVKGLQSGALRAAVFGISDGLVTNISLMLGVAGADADAGVVRLAGLAGMVAGAFSMAAGEYVSMAAQREFLEAEIDEEKQELRDDPRQAHDELNEIFTKQGISPEVADSLTDEIMAKPRVAVEVYARASLGVDPNSLGSPIAAAASSFVSFCIGAIIPLLPWFFMDGTAAVVIAIVLGAVAALGIGAAIGLSTGKSPLKTALRQLVLGTIAGSSSYIIGTFLGVQVT